MQALSVPACARLILRVFSKKWHQRKQSEMDVRLAAGRGHGPVEVTGHPLFHLHI